MALTPFTLSNPEPSRQRTWHVLKGEVLSLKHRPSLRYLEMRQECRTFKSAAPGPCDWLFLVLAMRARETSSIKTGNKMDEW